MDDENDPLNVNQASKNLNTTVLDRKRKIITQDTSTLDDLNSSDDEKLINLKKPKSPDIHIKGEALSTIDAIAKKISEVKPNNLSGIEMERNDLKCCGKSYETKSGILVPEKSLGPSCGCKKDVYCNKFALTEEQRKYIFNTYWGFGDSNKQLAFIIKFTKVCDKKLPNSSESGLMNKDCTYRYFLPNTEDLNGEMVRVCKKMFNNTLSSNFNISSIWRKYENRCGSKSKDLKTKRVNDKISSVCKHFQILQHSKLDLLKQRVAGLYTAHIEPVGIKKMFSQYLEWVDSKKYLDKAHTLAEYEEILARNIPQDHIMTLQQGDRKLIPTTNKNGDGKICIEIENIKEVNTETKVIFRPDDDFVEESDCESFHSNFSDELKTENEPKPDPHSLKHAVKEEREVNKETSSESSNSDSDSEIAPAKNSKHMRGRKLLEEKDEIKVVEFSNSRLDHTMGKSAGKQFLTNRGRLISLRPPCATTCKKKCFEKISEQQREFIFNHFWKLEKRSIQCSFLLQFTTRSMSKPFYRHHLKQVAPRYSYEYFLPLTEQIGDNSEKLRVCQTMFIRTLAISASNVTDSWEKEIGDLKDKKGLKCPWMNRKDLNESSNSADGNSSVTERKNNEISNITFNVKDYTLRKEIVGDKSIDDIELDNTHLDFIYRAMPWEEYLNAVSLPAKGTKEEKEEIDLDSFKLQEENGIKLSKKEKIQRNRLAKLARKSLRPPCSCARGCSDKINEEQRMFIFNFFWALNGISRRWAFLVRFSERYLPKRPRTRFPSRRQFSFNYYLPISEDMDGEKAPVCLKMMCNTLSIQNEIIRYAWLRYSKGRLLDKRGCHAKNVKQVSEITRNSIKDHVAYLQDVDPGLQSYKFPKSGWLKFKLVFRNYEQWIESSQYPPSCKPSLYRYRVLLYQALNIEVPPKWLKTVN